MKNHATNKEICSLQLYPQPGRGKTACGTKTPAQWSPPTPTPPRVSREHNKEIHAPIYICGCGPVLTLLSPRQRAARRIGCKLENFRYGEFLFGDGQHGHRPHAKRGTCLVNAAHGVLCCDLLQMRAAEGGLSSCVMITYVDAECEDGQARTMTSEHFSMNVHLAGTGQMACFMLGSDPGEQRPRSF